MQALFRDSGWTFAISSSGIFAAVHQHGPLYAAVVQSWQSFGCPQSGHWLASGAAGSVGFIWSGVIKVAPLIGKAKLNKASPHNLVAVDASSRSPICIDVSAD
jgi:hypothetical protein